MPFFQNSVTNKYLKTLDKQKLTNAYIKFKEHFHNPVHQENIRNSKEEQYQEGFLTDLFVDTLGYTKNPKTNYNLTTEYKNIKDAKKVDGAIILNDKVKAVIELKGTDTTDLGKVEEQAFGYKNNQPECVYVIISNFEKLRFYIDNAIDHIEFNLFTLSQSEFELLYLCLAFENIVKDLPKQIKNESLSSEDVITKKLYSDYSAFRRVLFQNIVQQNPQFDKLILFKKTQKLLDRFLFIFFAEDRQLLPPNSIRTILDQWKQLKELDSYKPLWERFKLYFHYMNVGRKGSQYDIFPYNGGLFLPDNILDSITIDDEILFEHTLKLSNYDYDTEVDVDILGHIFEHSLNEIEEIQSELEGKELDKTKTKRKKDGIFYTPKYITKYIVDNTVGKLCTEKKAELQINEADYISDKKIQKQTKQTRADKLTSYRNWLLQIKICDPACGSGAFLNQALDFLIKEHRYIDELQAKLFGASLILSDIENSILENNLFGVDLNEESVEIARLSLWLRTARPNRKLNDLSNNIKCGNSLIDDPAVAGDKAFNWFLEFPQVFPHYRKPKTEPTIEPPEPGDKDYLDEVLEPSYSYKPESKGFETHGFNVVIGNPPYVRAENIDKVQREYFISNNSKYSKTFGRFDLYIVFNELAIRILKQDGLLSFIFPSSFFNQNYSVLQRDWFLNEVNLIEMVDLSKIDVFKGVAVETAIIIVKNQAPTEFIYASQPIDEITLFQGKRIFIKKSIFNDLPNKTFRADLDESIISLITKIRLKSNLLEDFCYTVIGAVPHNSTTGASKDRLISNNCDNASSKKYLEGKNVNRYTISWDNRYLNYIPEEMHRPKFPELFENEKLLVRNISTSEGIMSTFDNENYYVNDTMSILIPWCKLLNVNQKGIKPSENQINLSSVISLKFLIALINSSIINFYFKRILSSNLHVYPEAIRNLPIINAKREDQLSFVQKADLMLSLNKQLQELSQKFQRTLLRKFNLLEPLPGKLQDWYMLSYGDLIKELGKKKIKLALKEEAEWEDYFLQESKKALELKGEIEKTDEEIDNMVYQLYGLTEDEIKIVENK